MGHKLRKVLIGLGVILAVGLAVAGLGLVTVERHTGFFAPVWDAEADGIYYVQRDSFGVTWGFGWETFTPPAYSYVMDDAFRLRHLALGAGEPETLGRWSTSPVEGRVTRHYRGRIFNTASARVEVTPHDVNYRVHMSIPRVPRSQQWSLEGRWSEATGASGDWHPGGDAYAAGSERVLVGGVELLVVRGRESYPAAILAVSADGDSRVLVENDEFDDLYPDGVPAEKIAEWSRRDQIEHVREFRRVQGELEAAYEAEGLNEGAATLRAYRDMEELGLLPRRPKMVATRVDDPPPKLRVFEIPAEYFDVGLFQDIAAAIEAPGTRVDTDTGDYLQYYDDKLGPRLKDWRAKGNDRFVVSTGGQAYIVSVLRPD